MKNVFYLIFSLIAINISAQNSWTQKANFPGGARAFTSEFTIGHYAFVGLGNNGNYLYDFWKWNETTNTWSAITNYPGNGSLDATSFTIEGKGYVCFGLNGSGVYNDLWRYDTISNAWTQMANFPGVARYDCQAFVIGHKAYIVAGSIGGPPYLQDFWIYDAHTNTWTQKNNWPGGLVEETIAFAIGNHGYVGDGWYPGCQEQMYEYDTTSDTWTSILPPPPNNGITEQPDSWVSGSRAYLCTGGNCNASGLRNGWMYDTVTKSWCEFNYISKYKLSRGNGVVFSINDKGYFCTGLDTNSNYLDDLWEYTPYTKINVSDTTNLCNGDSVKFSDSSSYLASAWSWSFPGGSPSNSNLQNPEVYYSAAGTYTAILVLTTCGDVDTVNRTISVTGGAANANIKGKSPICSGSSDTITASGGTAYLWSNGATTSTIIISPANTTTYSVQVTNGGCQGDTNITIVVDPSFTPIISGNDTICVGSQDILTATGGGSYLWSNGATSNSISVSPLTATTYSVKVTNGCVENTSFTVNTLPLPVINITAANSTICQGSSTNLIASGANSYLWTPVNGLSCDNCPNPIASPNSTTNYIVTGTDSHGCSSTASFVLSIVYPPTITLPPSQTICSGFTVNLVANTTGGAGALNWQPGNYSSPQIAVTPSVTTTYTVSYTNPCGTTSDTVTVFVAPSPTPSFSADITSGCAPLCVQFRDLSSLPGGKITMWSWAFGNGDTLNERNPIYCYPNTGSYTASLTVLSNDGCSATLRNINMITIYSKPIANFTYAPQPINILNPVVQFTDESTDAYGIAYRLWDFGDGENSYPENTALAPTHTYSDTGIYCPQLIVENDKGCIDTVTNCLFVEPLYTLYIPSAFSPNGDGVNDVFQAKGKYIKSFEMYIFDRWGMELFHSTDINQGWNGTVKGGNVISQEDSYVYKITATDWDDKPHSYTGEVTLLK